MDNNENDPPEILAESLPKNQIKVSDALNNPHRLISSFKKGLKVNSYADRGLTSGTRYEINIRVDKENMDRALRIMNALFKALESRGMEIFVQKEYKYPTCVRCLGQIAEIYLYEKTRMQKKEDDGSTYPSTEYIPTGELILKVGKSWNAPQCNDSKNRKLEECLNDFVIKIYREIFKQKAWDIEREKRRRQEEERYRQEEELRRKQEIELKKIQILEQSAFNWQKSRLIQSYLDASKKAYIEKNGEIKPNSEFQQWFSWANQHADRLDPLKGKEPQTLNIKIEDVDDLA